ncbi:MAG: GntR family transcriptional regulator [Lachnospiraceae bacterium]|nr:GntR family transcriptional regulator [Lachnospiraceae bacterium]
MAESGPKYRQVVDWVKENIENGNLKPGDRLMSEMELSEKFGLSRQTIRHATGELVSQQLVTRVQGSGTYIGSASALEAAAQAERPERERYMRIAVVSTFYDSYIFPPTIKGIERTLSKAGYTMQVSFTDNSIRKEGAIMGGLLENGGIDGLIVEGVKSALPNPNLPLYREFQKRGLPVLFFNACYPDLDAPCVRLDDSGVAERATKMLLAAGHRNIGAILKSDDGQGRLRYAGYLKALLDAGAPLGGDRLIWIDTPDYRDLTALETYILGRLRNISAVVCYNDEVAYQVIEMALRRGMRIPDDLSLVSVDDSSLAEVSKVPFTSFPHPKERLGRKAAENLLHMIDHPGFDGNALFDSEPVVRGSIKDFIQEGEKTHA